MNPPEITGSNSHAVLISEIADLRRLLWQVISAGKNVMESLPDRDKMILLEALIEAEKRLVK